MDCKSVTFKQELPDFWHAINILIYKPHVVNKRLWGSIVLKKYYIQSDNSNWNESLTDYKLNTMILLNIDEFIKELAQIYHFQVVKDETQFEIIFIELLPKVYMQEQRAIQMICIDKLLKKVTFYDITPAKQIVCSTCPYTFSFINDKITLKCG